MGQSRSNPSSAQYRGQLPEMVFSGHVEVVVGPTEAWKAAHANDPDAFPVEAECEITFKVSAIGHVPLATVKQSEWPGVAVPAGVVRIPLVGMKAIVKQQLEKDHAVAAAMIKLPGDPDYDKAVIVPGE